MDKELSDRELLELAAKAAGLRFKEGSDWHDVGMPYANGRRWDPLTDDGDALRLAVKLGLRIYAPDEDDPVAVVRDWTDARVTEEGEPCAATRRAIVRCAAEIGKGVA